MGPEGLVVTVVGAGGKMGMRVSRNLEQSAYPVFFCENHPAAQDRVRAAGRQLTDSQSAAAGSDVVILAVPDVMLGEVSANIVPGLKAGAILLTLDPAAAYAGVLATRPDIHLAVAHPCHPSVFLERTSAEEWADPFGGVAAPQDVVAALQSDDAAARGRAEPVIRTIYGPVLEPTLVETITCMISGLLMDALWESVNTAGVPEQAATAMLHGHIQVALTNSLKGSNPFSEACFIAMEYGRRTVIRDDWKKIFSDAELDSLIARMLHIDAVRPQLPIAAAEGGAGR